jgi:hypothetical protein
VPLLVQGVDKNIDSLAWEPSLIVPSVRLLWIFSKCTREEMLLLGCGLVHLGYRRQLITKLDHDAERSSGACLRRILGLNRIHFRCADPDDL